MTGGLRSLAALAALGGAFLAGAHLTGPGAPSGGEPSVPRAVAFHGELAAAASCEALLEEYVERGVALVGPYGWDGLVEIGDVAFGARDTVSAEQASDATTQRASSSETGANVQEGGVDEPDVVKTDGRTLWRVEGDTLTSYDVTGSQVEELATADLGEAPGVDDLSDVEILLVGDTVVALGTTREKRDVRTTVLTVDAADPAAPAVAHALDVDSDLLTARQHGDTVRVITAAGLPDLDFVQPGDRRGDGPSEREATERNEQIVERTTLADWLPGASLDGGPRTQLADCSQVAVPDSDLGLDTVSVLGFDAADPEALASRSDLDVTTVAAATSTAYASQDRLYLASSPVGWEGCWDLCRDPVASEDAGTTHVLDFELTTTGTSYAGSGQVDGLVADRWAMDEREGNLRLAVGPSEQTGNFNSVVTLRRDDDSGELVEVGRLDNLGPGEQIESVRWFDDLAIVVTFRQVDPLYTVDLTDPSSPRLLGKLKIPGFSEYLHPLGPHRVIGIGQGPTGRGWGAQAGLFSTSDLTQTRRLSVIDYAPGTEALAGADPRQFTWLPEQRVALTVVAQGWQGRNRGRTGWVSVLTLADGRLSNRMVEAAYGRDVATLRLVPLPDGRVVLSAADGASYFDV